ncbi:MAG TPA: RDD family protein [Acidimicrobiales bacterium]|nr:RDD family protein [Acidimicrobiales bacterium]
MAEWWQRLVAFALDMVILAVPSSIIIGVIARGAVPTGVISSTSVSPRVWEAIGVSFVVILGYFSFLDGSRGGQTVGKMAVGIAVRDIDTGGAVGAGRALLRRFVFFALYFGLILFVLNALSPLWDRRRQAWHDKVARSCVVGLR